MGKTTVEDGFQMVSARVTEELWARVKKEAVDLKCPVQDLVGLALERYFDPGAQMIRRVRREEGSGGVGGRMVLAEAVGSEKKSDRMAPVDKKAAVRAAMAGVMAGRSAGEALRAAGLDPEVAAFELPADASDPPVKPDPVVVPEEGFKPRKSVLKGIGSPAHEEVKGRRGF